MHYEEEDDANEADDNGGQDADAGMLSQVGRRCGGGQAKDK